MNSEETSPTRRPSWSESWAIHRRTKPLVARARAKSDGSWLELLRSLETRERQLRSPETVPALQRSARDPRPARKLFEPGPPWSSSRPTRTPAHLQLARSLLRGERGAVPPDSLTSTCWVLLLLLGCSGAGEPGGTGIERSPALVAQRVSATTRREAFRLVRLETEREVFHATPEHPFATPGSGWINAGRLAPGDWVVSERLGAVRLSSVHSEPTAQPVPVFNLSVASSHAYFVGTDRVLVHNTSCEDNREDDHGDDASESSEALERLIHERAELKREIKALTQAPASPRLAELKIRRAAVQRRIDRLRRTQRSRQGITQPTQSELSRQLHEADHEAARSGLEAAQRELAQLESQPPSEAGAAAFLARRTALHTQLKKLTLTYDRTGRILRLFAELAELEKNTPATAANRQAVEERKQGLRATLEKERRREGVVRHLRRKRAEKGPEYDRETRRPPHQQLARLENDLAERLQEPPSAGRDARIRHLETQIETMKRLFEIRKQLTTVRKRRARALETQEELLAQGRDTSHFDAKVEEAQRDLHALHSELSQLKQSLAPLKGTASGDAPANVDEPSWGPPPVDLRQRVLAEANDVDETLGERDQLMQQRPSPERAFGLQSSYERLQQELREERAAVEVALSALVNEYAHTQTTQAGSSSGPGWQERLRALQEEQVQLRAQWRARLQARLDSARAELELLRQMTFRDAEIEHDVSREVALLERELQRAG